MTPRAPRRRPQGNPRRVVTERMELRTGQDLWTWMIRSNPVAEAVLAILSLDEGERSRVALALERMVRERADG
jgi:hypothetical protein